MRRWVMRGRMRRDIWSKAKWKTAKKGGGGVEEDEEDEEKMR